MADLYASAQSVESAIKDAAKRSSGEDPSLNVTQRIRIEYFNRFLSRVFSEGERSAWVLKGGTGMLSRVPSARATRDIDLQSPDMHPFPAFTTPASWGTGYAKLAKPISHCTGYPTVDSARDLVKQLIDPALAGEADDRTWSYPHLMWR